MGDLKTMYVGRYRVYIMTLKQRISNLTKGYQFMAKYLQGVKSILDELSIIDHPFDETNLVIYTLNGLTIEYCEIFVSLRSKESHIVFAQLHENLMDFEDIHHSVAKYVADIVATANVFTRNKRHKYMTNNDHNSPYSTKWWGGICMLVF